MGFEFDGELGYGLFIVTVFIVPSSIPCDIFRLAIGCLTFHDPRISLYMVLTAVLHAVHFGVSVSLVGCLLVAYLYLFFVVSIVVIDLG